MTLQTPFVTSLSQKLLKFKAIVLTNLNKGLLMKLFFKHAVVGVAAMAALGFAAQAGAQEVTGAGASFPAPLYAKWAADYNKATSVKINYQSVGSGAGIKQIDAKTVDFGASDMPLKGRRTGQEEPAAIPHRHRWRGAGDQHQGHRRWPAEAVRPGAGRHFPGQDHQVERPRREGAEPTLALPDDVIAPVRRADGSGTSFIFTNYLSKVSPEWKTKVGEGTAVNWPTGAGGKGNEGVAAFVGRLPNSIGYVEYAYVKQNKMVFAQMQNAAGNFVSPNDDAFKAAAAGADWTKSFYQILTAQPGKDSWPLTGATFILMHKVQDKPAQATAVLKFFDWAYKNGDKTADELDYVPMPATVKTAIEKAWGDIKDASGKPVAFK